MKFSTSALSALVAVAVSATAPPAGAEGSGASLPPKGPQGAAAPSLPWGHKAAASSLPAKPAPSLPAGLKGAAAPSLPFQLPGHQVSQPPRPPVGHPNSTSLATSHRAVATPLVPRAFGNDTHGFNGTDAHHPGPHHPHHPEGGEQNVGNIVGNGNTQQGVSVNN